MIKVDFYTAEHIAMGIARHHRLYNAVKRGWKVIGGIRVYGWWVGYSSNPSYKVRG